tara:strand:+ start:5687 stop:5968 length:282 start_codon:yes stop_codon:yes gene_type:complete
MNSGDINIDNNDIPVMKFKNLKDIINKQYPGYRSTSGYVSLVANSVGGNMNVNTFANSLYGNVQRTISDNNSNDKNIKPVKPEYISTSILPFN